MFSRKIIRLYVIPDHLFDQITSFKMAHGISRNLAAHVVLSGLHADQADDHLANKKYGKCYFLINMILCVFSFDIFPPCNINHQSSLMMVLDWHRISDIQQVDHICWHISVSVGSKRVNIFGKNNWVQCKFCINKRKLPDLSGSIVSVHWGRVTHICVSELTIIGSDNGYSPVLAPSHYLNQCWNIINSTPIKKFSQILIEIHTFSFKKMHLKMSSGKWRPFCLGLNMLMTKATFVFPYVAWVKAISNSSNNGDTHSIP